MGQSKFSYELTFWFISIENGGKQKILTHLAYRANGNTLWYIGQ